MNAIAKRLRQRLALNRLREQVIAEMRGACEDINQVTEMLDVIPRIERGHPGVMRRRFLQPCRLDAPSYRCVFDAYEAALEVSALHPGHGAHALARYYDAMGRVARSDVEFSPRPIQHMAVATVLRRMANSIRMEAKGVERRPAASMPSTPTPS